MSNFLLILLLILTLVAFVYNKVQENRQARLRQKAQEA